MAYLKSNQRHELSTWLRLGGACWLVFIAMNNEVTGSLMLKRHNLNHSS
jgi:hypothetical protein